jgi:hypothetical protein
MTLYLLTAHGQIPLALDSAETFAVLANPDTRPRRAVAAAGRPSPRIDDHQAKVTRQLPAARVNPFEADFFGNHCVVAYSLGSLIHTAVGSAGGWGGLRTKRSRCSAEADLRTTARCSWMSAARP